jgi:hypothetical protein
MYGSEKDPIDKAVAEMYDTKEEALKLEAGKIKRKRNFYWNCIVYDADGNPEYKVLRDTTNEGKLTRVLCKKMGIPFFRDVEDNWLGEDGAADVEGDEDEQPDYVDLLDTEEGHDFYIVKKVTGKNNWDFNFEDSYASKKARELTDAETELLEQRVDLTTYINYIEDIDEVSKKLAAYLNGDDAEVEDVEDDEDETPAPKKAAAKAPAKKAAPAKAAKKSVVEDDVDIEDLAAELDDED